MCVSRHARGSQIMFLPLTLPEDPNQIVETELVGKALSVL